ncbi:hypothetical protein U9M48_008179 [Paspalum notatum var. saurae]|uniref:Uncharacterized protein n=1 Tax=Paspalum notatum var. saurae TaxID=547442 RepID=A0AAQ3SNJ8_PASNO
MSSSSARHPAPLRQAREEEAAVPVPARGGPHRAAAVAEVECCAAADRDSSALTFLPCATTADSDRDCTHLPTMHADNFSSPPHWPASAPKPDRGCHCHFVVASVQVQMYNALGVNL